MKTLITLILLVPFVSLAQDSMPIMNTLTQETDGSYTLMLESGQTYHQYSITPQLDRVDVASTTWYVSDKGIINATSDLQAVSIYLTK